MEQAYTDLNTLCDQPGVAGLGDRLRVIRDVMRGLVESGVVKAADVWSWLPIILKLMIELGPIVQDILDRIKKAIGSGKTADTFA